MLIGYARVSTQDQNLDLQKDALKKAGCKKIYDDKASGAEFNREGLKEAIEYIREGDTLVVWKLDRLGRSLKQLIETVNELNSRGIGLMSLQENIDTTTSGGKLIFHIFGALAEFERDIIKERTQAGLNAARARGRKGGRPKSMDEKKIEMAKTLLENPNSSIKDICKTLNISKATLYRYVPAEEIKEILQNREKEIKVILSLRVEGNNKFIRGVKKTREEIERFCLSRYHMKKLDRGEYELTISYTNDEDLDKVIYDLMSEIEFTADARNCFTESDVRTLDREQSW